MSTHTRAVASVIAAGAMLIATVVVATPAAAVTQGDFDSVRARYVTTLTGGPSIPAGDQDVDARIAKITATAQSAWDSLDTSPSRAFLWSDIAKSVPGIGSEYITSNYGRIYQLALALKTQRSPLYENAALKANVISALDWMNANWYTATTAQSGNWFPWELGGPLALDETTMLMYGDLTSAQRASYMAAVAHFKPTITMASGANRAWEAQVFIQRGIISADSAVITTGKNAISALLTYQTNLNSDGFYRDGSTIAHGSFAYTAGYSLWYYTSVVQLLYWLDGSPWAVTDPARSNLVSWAFDSFVPLLYRGTMIPYVNGRDVARKGNDDHVAGIGAVMTLLRVADIAPAAQSAQLKSLVKEWLLSGLPQGEAYANSSVFLVLTAKALANDPGIARSGQSDLYAQFPTMDRAVIQKPGWAFGVGMFSTRTTNFESINGENLKGWHLSDGATYLYSGSDLDQYSDNYWPTVDPYRIPGTTVLEGRTEPSARSTQAFVGGTELGGRYGVSGMALATPGTALTARKSWFAFDDEIVNLGAGIASTDGVDVETIVDNRKLNAQGTNPIVVNGATQPSAPGWSASLGSVNWLNVAGSAADSGVGYVFPGGASLSAARETRTGSWKDINTLSPYNDPTPVSNTFAKFWYNHGVNPSAASYSYVTLPKSSSAQTQAYSTAPETIVLSNDASVQAVKENSLNIIGANFFSDGAHGVSVGSYPDFLTSTKKASVMEQETGTDLTISVADPTMADNGVITVELKKPTTAIIRSDPGITVLQYSPTTRIAVNLDGAKGTSREITLSKTGSAPRLVDNLVDSTKTSGVSAGMTFDTTSTIAYFLGDGSRAVRSANTTESISWNVTGATSFEASAFAIDGYASKFVFSSSPNGTTWTTVPTTSTVPASSGGSWTHATITNSAPLPQGTGYVRAQLANDTRGYSPQLGSMLIR